MKFREYGGGPREVVVLHGGPGAPGSAGGLAALLADSARVLEPWQEATTVAGHIEETRAFIEEHCETVPFLVGHSWGAMLALPFAAAHPVRAIALVGSGTFDEASRMAFKQALAEPPGLSRAEKDAFLDRAYNVDAIPEQDVAFDERANRLSSDDMARLRADGTYPAAFAAIKVPVLMVHGADDPHPGRMIRDSLLPFLPQLEYRELARCGHYPWRERQARDAFLKVMREWLA